MARTFKDRTVLITGASRGIGEAIARRFAADGARLMLVARQEGPLQALAGELADAGGAQVQTFPADLCEPDAASRVYEVAVAAFGQIDVLINNAGVGEYGQFAEQDIEAIDRMMRLNMTALVRLTHLVLPQMLARRSGWIMNVASLAAYQPTPYMGIYGSTKAFVLSHSMSVREEVRRKGIVVTCVCPGPVRTGFFSRGGYDGRMQDYSKLMAEPESVGQAAHAALARGKAVCMPGWKNKASALAGRLIPLSLLTKISGRVLRPSE